jgi:hypothetical protein
MAYPDIISIRVQAYPKKEIVQDTVQRSGQFTDQVHTVITSTVFIDQAYKKIRRLHTIKRSGLKDR